MENQPLCGPLGAPDDENALPSRGLLLKEEAKKRKCSPREEKGGGGAEELHRETGFKSVLQRFVRPVNNLAHDCSDMEGRSL